MRGVVDPDIERYALDHTIIAFNDQVAADPRVETVVLTVRDWVP